MTKMTKKEKQTLELLENVNQPTTGVEAIKVLKDISSKTSKFDETLELHMKLGINVKHAEQQVRGTTVLPAGTGKTVKICVVAKGEKMAEATQAGADYVGAEDIVEKIAGGWLDFDTLIATPDAMGMLGKLGKVLGPKGLMPNPKTGTVTFDVKKAINDAKAGKVEYRADKQGIIHVPLGKMSFSEDDLIKNFVAVADAVIKAKPSATKGTYVKSVYLTTTMGPSVKVDDKNIASEVKSLVS